MIVLLLAIVMASKTDDVVVEESRRSCSQCNIRMSSLLYDKRSICFACRVQNCLPNLKCGESNFGPRKINKYLTIRTKIRAECKAEFCYVSVLPWTNRVLINDKHCLFLPVEVKIVYLI